MGLNCNSVLPSFGVIAFCSFLHFELSPRHYSKITRGINKTKMAHWMSCQVQILFSNHSVIKKGALRFNKPLQFEKRSSDWRKEHNYVAWFPALPSHSALMLGTTLSVSVTSALTWAGWLSPTWGLATCQQQQNTLLKTLLIFLYHACLSTDNEWFTNQTVIFLKKAMRNASKCIEF